MYALFLYMYLINKLESTIFVGVLFFFKFYYIYQNIIILTLY